MLQAFGRLSVAREIPQLKSSHVKREVDWGQRGCARLSCSGNWQGRQQTMFQSNNVSAVNSRRLDPPHLQTINIRPVLGRTSAFQCR
jgi:hypothetical protein